MVTDKDLENLMNKVDEVVDKQYDFIKEMKDIKQTIWQMRAHTNTSPGVVEEHRISEEIKAVVTEAAPPVETVAPTAIETAEAVEEVVATTTETAAMEVVEAAAPVEEVMATTTETAAMEVAETATPVEEVMAPTTEMAALVAEPAPAKEEAAATVEETTTIAAERLKTERENNKGREAAFSTNTHKSWDWERFIGQNLLSKIGIAILLIGVFIGVKYSIDRDLISREMRLVLGYAVGAGLFVTGAMLKKKYENFSAILVSGAMATFYFVTFVAYSVFEFFPQALAFVLMFVFTAFTVLASLSYNQVTIALIGLVGSYAIPFLLSNNSGRIDILFTYTAIINIGVLVLSFYKQWMQLFVSAFFFTWILLVALYMDTDPEREKELFWTFMSFGVVTFLTFYSSFIAQKVQQVRTLTTVDVAVFLMNSLLFYGIISSLIHSVYANNTILAGFTLANALFHFGVAYYFHTRKEDYNTLKYLVLVLALSFATLVIPIQFKGSWITLFWSAEAALLFSLGRVKGLVVFERIGYAVTALATGSMIIDWGQWAYSLYVIEDSSFYIAPFANTLFVNALLYCAAMGLMVFVNQKYKAKDSYDNTVTFFLNVCFVGGVYYTFFREIGVMLDMNALKQPDFFDNYALIQDLSLFKYSAYIIYSMAFLVGYSILNIKFLKNKVLTEIQLSLGFILSGMFLLLGLYYFSELRGRYIEAANDGDTLSLWFLNIRYLGIAAFGLLCYTIYKLQQSLHISTQSRKSTELLLHLAILWVASSELLHWTQLYESTSNYKLGLTILWGAYAILLIILGLLQKKKYLRAAGMTLISFSILKLFVYDIIHLDALRITIVFVILGLLILVASFLYYKFTKNEESETKNGENAEQTGV
nr:DUF2339 domain-containing protein [uncultured Capnocytophaga sp.]